MEEPLKEYEEKKLNSFHIKTMLIAGAGQIVDGYDLTAAALVTTSLMAYFGSSLLTLSTYLFASIISGNIVGALIFGYLAKHGRKRFYGVDAALMTLGALLQAFVSSPSQLVFLRFLLGLGIGADYVLSPLVAAEYANRKDRGKMLGIAGGVMWNVGALISAVVTLTLGYFLPSDILWRAVLALGSVPAISVIIARRRYPETPHYLLFIKRDLKELGERYNVRTFLENVKRVSGISLSVLLLAALSWYLYDIGAYSGVFFGPSVIAQKLGINGVLFELIILAAFSVPWNFVSAMTNDRLGRRKLQAIGFVGMGLTTLLFAFLLGKVSAIVTLLVYGISSIFNSLGPGTIVGFWGVELFPAEIRGVTQGITVLGGRLGVLTTTFLFPILLADFGIFATMITLGVIAIGAAGVSMMLPEPARVSLSKIEVSGLSALREVKAQGEEATK
ncbi:MAG: MFS transporter [Metallosphaera sp.]